VRQKNKFYSICFFLILNSNTCQKLDTFFIHIKALLGWENGVVLALRLFRTYNSVYCLSHRPQFFVSTLKELKFCSQIGLFAYFIIPCASRKNLVGFYPVGLLLQLMRLNCVQQASISTSSTFTRGQHVCVSLSLARGDIAMLGGSYAGLCNAFLVYLYFTYLQLFYE